MFDQGRGFERGEGRKFAIPLMASPHTDISHIGGHLACGLFSSPEHEVLMVSYCDQSMSVVRRASSTICFKS